MTKIAKKIQNLWDVRRHRSQIQQDPFFFDVGIIILMTCIVFEISIYLKINFNLVQMVELYCKSIDNWESYLPRESFV